MTGRADPVAEDALPAGLLLAYYGDDFTGSTDALEALSAAGLATVLFLAPPDVQRLADFGDVRCVGLAGMSRSRSPAWMDEHLPAAFDSLAGLGAPLLQYKVCSTFDSSPAIGSIGHAIDLGNRCAGRNRFDAGWTPTLVGVPRLGRYQAFGNLFAAHAGQVHRLDRHPTMSRHPVTPMPEADLRRHLAGQTARRIELIDLVALKSGAAAAQLARLRGADTPAVLVDVVDDDTLRLAGELVWTQRGNGLFSASSSGLDYALVAYWRSRGWLAPQGGLPRIAPVDRIAVVSGSCSPVTAGQIDWAQANGFACLRLDLAQALDPQQGPAQVDRLVGQMQAALQAGRSPLVYSARGPDDGSVVDFEWMAQRARLTPDAAARQIGQSLAAVMSGLLERAPLTRVVVAGGDSSGEVASALGIDALTVVAGLAPGAPLCRAWSRQPARNGLELVLKGGQMGAPSFFGQALGGQAVDNAGSGAAR